MISGANSTYFVTSSDDSDFPILVKVIPISVEIFPILIIFGSLSDYVNNL